MTFFPLCFGFLTALVPVGSKAEPSKPGPVPQVPLEADRYVGSSADWEKLRKDSEGDADNSFRRARHLESRQLAAGAPGVRREGKAVFLKINDGKEVKLIDDGTGDSTTSYSYYDVVPALDAYVLHAQSYEGDAWLLVSRQTRSQTNVADLRTRGRQLEADWRRENLAGLSSPFAMPSG